MSHGVLVLAERHVGDRAEAGAVVVQRANMAPVHVLGAVAEIFGAVGSRSREYRISLGRGGDEGVQRVVGLGRGGPLFGLGSKAA